MLGGHTLSIVGDVAALRESGQGLFDDRNKALIVLKKRDNGWSQKLRDVITVRPLITTILLLRY